jgi:parallel beta-helix repeat protein
VDANGDGIGDTPYVIDADNQDRYPLMHPWSSRPVHNINTGLGYATIQEAINANETINGHVIFVEAGTYYENIVVNKTVSLVGKDQNTAMIDGMQKGHVINVAADNVTITGFTITNSSAYYPYSGIYIASKQRSNIVKNNLAHNYFGVWLYGSSVSNMSGNNITASNSNGIWLYDGSSDNIISENNIKANNGIGICVSMDCSKNIISKNNITENEYGIWFHRSSNNSVFENSIRANDGTGIIIDESSNNNIFRNIITTNWQGILLSDSYDNIIFGNNITNNENGIRLSGSSNNIIRGNNIANNSDGMSIDRSSENVIYHNNFVNNTYWQAVTFQNSANFWDDGYPSSGNYWSDYVGVDVKNGIGQDLPGSDGIGDTPYVIDANNVDHYPLTNPYGVPPPPTYALTITATVGGTTDPLLGTYSYAANSTVQATAIPAANYLFEYWELDGVNVGSANPYSVYMDKDHMLKAVFSLIPPPLQVSISPLSASILVGQSVTFTSTVSGGYAPYSYQWYLNGNPVSGANATSWTFTPTSSGIYYVHFKVTDAKVNTAQSETARITVAAVPVGGYSIPIQLPTKAQPVTLHIALLTILTALFIKIKRKAKRKH